MSVSNLLAPNDYELYIGTLHVDDLIIPSGVTGANVTYSGFFARATGCFFACEKVGDFVNLSYNASSGGNINTGSTGDKNSALFTNVLIPAEFRPPRITYGNCVCTNNGLFANGIAHVATDGSLAFGLPGSTTSSIGSALFSFSTATGVAGVNIFNITYSLV